MIASLERQTRQLLMTILNRNGFFSYFVLLMMSVVVIHVASMTSPHQSPIRLSSRSSTSSTLSSMVDARDTLPVRMTIIDPSVSSLSDSSPSSASFGSDRRRTLLRGMLGPMITSTVVWKTNPPSAIALQERNEILCGTGFFTNIALYKCTDIGDISDEGKSRPLTTNEQGSMQGLMDKMGMDDSIFEEDNKKKKKTEDKVNIEGKKKKQKEES